MKSSFTFQCFVLILVVGLCTGGSASKSKSKSKKEKRNPEGQNQTDASETLTTLPPPSSTTSLAIVPSNVNSTSSSESSSEETQGRSCSTLEFKCGSLCLNHTLLCDGVAQCDDKSDEEPLHCPEMFVDDPCIHFEDFKCANGKCISSKWVCDGVRDCSLNNDGDFSDENNCPASNSTKKKDSKDLCDQEESWKCASGACIHKPFLCDGEPDCSDGSDEGQICKEAECVGKFRCISGDCVDLSFKCNGNGECKDGWSDEANCLQPHECPKEEGRFLCRTGEHCIDAIQVCDRKPDCPDNSDEFPACEKSCKKAACSQGCVPDPDLSKPGLCYCFGGFEPSKRDKGKCVDVDECQVFGTCSQVCTNLVGSHTCTCINGFTLASDNSSCQLTDNKVFLVFALHSGVRVLSMGRTEKFYSISENVGSPVSVGYNARDNYIYWTDAMVDEETVWRSRLNGSEVEAVVNTGLVLPEGIAIDWITSNIYFTDSNNSHVVVCTGDGKNCTILIQEQMDKPRDLAVHPNQGILFWTDWGVRPAIIRAGMDGSTPLAIITENLKWPNGITVDHGNSRIYWTDAGTDRIETAKFDGNDRQLVRSSGIKHPFGVDVIGDMVFWSDWNMYEIQSSNKFNGTKHRTWVKEPYEQLNGLALFHKANQPITRRNHCKDAGCSHICVLGPENSFKCVCPIGLKLEKTNRKKCLDEDTLPKFLVGYNNTIKTMIMHSIGGNVFAETVIPTVQDISGLAYNPVDNTVFFGDQATKRIYQYSIQNKTLKVLVQEGIQFIKGLDFDVVGQNLFWVDSVKRTIEGLSLGTGVRAVVFTEIDRPMDIVIDSKRRVMFVAEIGDKGATILGISLHKFGRMVLVRRPKGEILGLAYDSETERLFWADAISSTIESIGIDGTGDFITEGRAGSPYGLAAYKGRVFWTDRHTQLLRGKRLEVSNQDRPIFIGTQTNASHLSGTYAEGNFLSRVKIMDRNIGDLVPLMARHACSPMTPREGVLPLCSHICLLLTQGDPAESCECPEGLHLDPHRRSCIAVKQLPKLDYNYEDAPPSASKSSEGSLLLQNRSVGSEDEGKNVVTEGGHPLAITLGVIMILILLGVIAGVILHKKNVHPKVLVRPYVQQWVKYVNQPVHRLFNEPRGDQIEEDDTVSRLNTNTNGDYWMGDDTKLIVALAE